MTLRTQINEDMKTALRAQAKDKLAAIRLIFSAIKQKEIDDRIADGLSDAQVMEVLTKLAKQRRDSIEQYQAANRSDLADKEQFELDIIQAYLPKMLSEAETKAKISALISELGAAGPQDMGKVMGALKAKFAAEIDMKQASAWVKSLLLAN